MIERLFIIIVFASKGPHEGSFGYRLSMTLSKWTSLSHDLVDMLLL